MLPPIGQNDHGQPKGRNYPNKQKKVAKIDHVLLPALLCSSTEVLHRLDTSLLVHVRVCPRTIECPARHRQNFHDPFIGCVRSR